MLETLPSNAGWDCFKTLIMQEILKTQKWTSGRILCIFGSHTLVCKKQTSVSHSSTESEIISPEAGLRMDGIPALDLGDLVTEVFHSVPNRTGGPKRDTR